MQETDKNEINQGANGVLLAGFKYKECICTYHLLDTIPSRKRWTPLS